MYGLLIVSSLLVLLSASVSDIRTREVNDTHWIVLGVLAVTTSLVREDFLYTVACVSVLAYVFIGREMLLAITAIAMVISIHAGSWETVTMLSTTSLMIILYWTGLLRGGADAKALIVISMLFPTLESGIVWHAEGMASYVFNPALSTLTLALLMSMSYCVVILRRNVCDGRIHKRMLTSYYISEKDADESFVWRADVTTNGQVMVTPMIPFLPPITVSFIVVVVLGNPMLALV